MPLTFSPAVDGQVATIGSGFNMLHFNHTMFDERRMSPVVMVDHFHMSSPTFQPHPHAGMSAVTLAFQDTRGAMVSVDSTGRSSMIMPGDLHWTLAGRGIVHTQRPLDSRSHIHALQIFVNLPAADKGCAPRSFLVPRSRMPTVALPNALVTVVAGNFAGVASPAALPQPLLMLDIETLGDTPNFQVPLPGGWNATLLAINGAVRLSGAHELTAGCALTVRSLDDNSALEISSIGRSHLVLLAGPQIDEPVVQQGPFVLDSAQALSESIQAYQRGDFGTVTQAEQNLARSSA
jgi:redox-sensitive bicupin YhaK (pirin superfamily)